MLSRPGGQWLSVVGGVFGGLYAPSLNSAHVHRRPVGRRGLRGAAVRRSATWSLARLASGHVTYARTDMRNCAESAQNKGNIIDSRHRLHYIEGPVSYLLRFGT